MPDRKAVGEWGKEFPTIRVAVHATLLPNGKILCWGRRSNPAATVVNLDERQTRPFFIDVEPWNKPLATGSNAQIPVPKASDIEPQPEVLKNINLFCSGHCLDPKGRLLVAGGHEKDGLGIKQACVYDYSDNTWTARPPLNGGRWYPSALTLPTGDVLVISGSYTETYTVNNIPQIWHNDTSEWITVPNPPQISALYPKLHLDPRGQIFVCGPQAESQILSLHGVKKEPTANGKLPVEVLAWTPNGPERNLGAREYGSSVMYDSGKILFVGGGNSKEPDAEGNIKDAKGNPIPFLVGPPTNITEFIDLNQIPLEWVRTKDMQFPRRHHNATVLPDGTVLVTGGTRGPGFNNLNPLPVQPVHMAELWSPDTGEWTQMAEEVYDRCYHSIALLLPDGRILSAGGGEYDKDQVLKNSITKGQLFSPPYLFKGGRPTIQSNPKEIEYATDFPVTSLIFLKFKQDGSKLTIQAPANPNLAPPGHYMLFLLSQQGVPCVAPILQLKTAPLKSTTNIAQRAKMATQPSISLPELNEKVIAAQETPPVAVGLTPVCPYGLGPCWGGAFEALQRISDVAVVRPVPDQADSIAFVYLKGDTIPDIDAWRKEFASTAHSSYEMRGIEMTLSGVATKRYAGSEEEMTLVGTSTRPDLILTQFQEASNLKFDIDKRANKPITKEEASAYMELLAALKDNNAGVEVQVVGRLQKHGDNKFSLEVREFEMLG